MSIVRDAPPVTRRFGYAAGVLPPLILTILTLPTLVLVHEGGHVWAARAFGAKARMRWARYGPETIAELNQSSRAVEAAFFLAGALANIAVAIGAVLLLGRFGAWVALLHASYGVGQLLPRAGSDGVKAWRAFFGARRSR